MSDNLFNNNPVCSFFNIRFPIIQAGMVWVSGWKLCSAVSRAGGLGLLGSGSMKPDLLREHIIKTRTALGDEFPFGVNLTLMRKDVSDLVNVCLEEKVKIFFNSAGNPALWTEKLKSAGAIAVHVVPNAKLARKAAERGVDAVICEGVEAGGHNGVDEIPTFTLVPQVRDAVKIPVIAAGGIADGRGMAAAFALGADGVQIGTRFAATIESSASDRYKQAVVDAGESDTVLALRNIGLTRMIKTPFALQCVDYEKRGVSADETRALLGEKRERKGIFEGLWGEGQLEAGVSAGLIREVLPAAVVVENLIREYTETVQRLGGASRA
ncbi:nitronate monooxygenase [candidate division KSB1 bacterium]|nr:MAG: nitronate monooxygenase [candidate division KSB1 bacterium]